MTNDELIEEAEKYRYQVEIRLDRYAGIQVSHTHNDSQWSTLNVKNITELKQLREAVDGYIKDNEP